MFDWLRAGIFSWKSLKKKLDKKYPERGAAIVTKLKPAHSKVIRGLDHQKKPPPRQVELCVDDPVFSDKIPDDFFKTLSHPAHDTLKRAILAHSRTSDRLRSTNASVKKLKDRPEAEHLHIILVKAYFPYLEHQFREAVNHQKLQPAIISLLAENLKALTLGISWCALIDEENRAIQDVLAYWLVGNFILTMKGNQRSGTILALSPPEEKEVA